jgi:methyl-accepting chemotaxis protein
MFRSINARVLVGTLALALVPLLAAVAFLTWLSTTRSQQALEQRAFEQLAAIRTVKTSEIESYAREVEQFMRLFAASPVIREATRDLRIAFDEQTTSFPADQLAAARTELTDYYTVDFINEYQSKNPGVARLPDMAAVVAAQSAQAVTMQLSYIARNPNPLGTKNLLVDAADGTRYAELHARLQPFMAKAFKEYGFYDFFLVDAENGNVIYTYFKELDYASSLIDGPYASTGLGQAFALARESDDINRVQSTEFAPYGPSYDDQAAFVSLPIMDESGTQRLGILVAQLPIDRIDRIMTFNRQWADAGLSASGEVYLVGPDATPRSNSRFLVENKATFLDQLTGLTPELRQIIDARQSWNGLVKLDTEGAKAALSGERGEATYNDYRNIKVLGSYAPLNFIGRQWGVMAEIDEAEAFRGSRELLQTIFYAALGAVALMGLLGIITALWLARSINRPIRRLSDTVKSLNDGDFDARAHITSGDELGQLGGALDQLLDERLATLNQQSRENEQLNNSVIEIMQAVGQLAQRDLTVQVPVTADVTGAVSDAINLMTSETSAALRQVFNISANVAQASSRVKQRSDAVLTMAEQSGQEVAAASEELAQAASALNLIAKDAQIANSTAENVIRATGEALRAVSATVGGVSASRDIIRETEKRIKRLGERSQEISAVVSIIGNIAERTSILALNAAMQAVAAGEAGRGFAVVAEEVKRLAENARDATQQISNLVGGIQADTVDAVQSMNEAITQVVDISKLAERAGAQMNETQLATSELVASVRGIAQTTAAQAKVSDTLMNRASQIAQSTRTTLDQVTQQNVEKARLLQFARGLLDTVRQFKLPTN